MITLINAQRCVIPLKRSISGGSIVLNGNHSMNVFMGSTRCNFMRTISYTRTRYQDPVTDKKSSDRMLEYVFGRTRIYHRENRKLGWSWSRKDEQEEGGAFRQWARATFLPVGYPDTTHECYLSFHLWQGLETVVSGAVFFPSSLILTLGEDWSVV